MTIENLPKQLPIEPQKLKRKFEVIEGGRKEEIKGKKVASAAGGAGGWWRRLPWYGKTAVIGGPLVGAAAVVGGLEAGGVIDVIPEGQSQQGDRITEDENGNPVAVLTTETTQQKSPETTVPPETTVQETTPPTTEVVETGPIEYEGVMIKPIEGLRFDKGTFFAEAGNPYGLEAEAKAGILVKEAFEFNKEKINSIAFCSEVIDFWQHKFFDEKGKIFLPIPLDPIQAKGAQIDVVDDMAPTSLDRTGGTSLLINAPIGTKIYAPLKTELREDYWLWRTGTSFVPDPCGRKDGLSDKNSYQVSFPLEPFFNPNKINYEGFDFEVFEDIDNVGIKMSLQGVSPLPPLADAEVNYLDINTNNYIQADEFDSLQKEGHLIIPFRLISMNLGEPVVEIIAEPYESPKFSGLCSAEIFFNITLLSQNKSLVLGDESVMMELSGSKVSILPANE